MSVSTKVSSNVSSVDLKTFEPALKTSHLDTTYQEPKTFLSLAGDTPDEQVINSRF